MHGRTFKVLLEATASAVVADLKSQHNIEVSKCVKIPTRKVRWACLGPGGSSPPCSDVRIVPWVPWTTKDSNVCAHLPPLRKFLGKRS